MHWGVSGDPTFLRIIPNENRTARVRRTAFRGGELSHRKEKSAGSTEKTQVGSLHNEYMGCGGRARWLSEKKKGVVFSRYWRARYRGYRKIKRRVRRTKYSIVGCGKKLHVSGERECLHKPLRSEGTKKVGRIAPVHVAKVLDTSREITRDLGKRTIKQVKQRHLTEETRRENAILGKRRV